MATVKINGREYSYEYVNKCELCDVRGADGNCSLPKNMECPENYVFKRVRKEEE